MAVAFLLMPGSWAAVGMALGYALVKFRSRPLIKLSFNLAQIFCSAAAGALVASLLGGGVVAACAGLATYAAAQPPAGRPADRGDVRRSRTTGC